VTVQLVDEPEQPPPVKPVKSDPELGCAVSVIWVVVEALTEQAECPPTLRPQSMAAGDEST
jgi:hypothetical protein